MYSGDGKNSVEKVRRELNKLRYISIVNYDLLLKGNPEAFIGLFRFIFCEYSRKLSKHFLDLGYEMTGMPDRKFMETVYRLMRDVFEVKPSVTLAQFFLPGFAERKMDMLANVSAMARELHLKISKPGVQKSALSCNVVNSKSFQNSEKETEIIEINPPRPATKRRTKTDRVPSKSHPKKPHKSTSSNEENISQGNESQENVIPVHQIPSNDLPLNPIPLCVVDASVPYSQRLRNSETQTSCKTDALLGSIASKLENITARLTILETRMTRVEEKFPNVLVSKDDGFSNRLRFPSGDKPVHGNNGRTSTNNSSNPTSTGKKTVEAVVLDLAHQPPAINKSVKMYDVPKKDTSNSLGCDSHVFRDPPRHYSPTLYRLDSSDIAISEKTSDEYDIVSSEEEEIEEEICVSSLPPRSPQKNMLSKPDSSLDVEKDISDSFQSQINRIQQMIQNTNMMLNPSAEPLSS